MVKILLIVLISVTGFLLLLEGGLRVFFGLGTPLIYIPDENIGYLLAPNQKVRRFGKRIEINQYSMRTHPITRAKPDSNIRIFLLGDSIVNGGWWTDQQDTISALIDNQLSNAKLSGDQDIEVLNASANSWSPRNQLAYLQKFGLFESQIVVLLINTDDLFGRTPNSAVVGRDRNYPAARPPLALIEVYQDLFGSKQAIPKPPEKGDRVGINLETINQIKKLTTQAHGKFLLVMTPLLRETQEPGSKKHELKARKRLQDFADSEQITYIDFLPQFQQFSEPELLYRDHIHLSQEGNRLVSETIVQSLQELLKAQTSTPTPN